MASDGTAGARRTRVRGQAYLRVAPEYSRFAYERADFVSFEGAGVDTYQPLESPVERRAWGGRFEGGFALITSPQFAVVPRASISVAHLEAEREQYQLVGVRQSLDSSPWYGAVAVGAEVQLIRRIFGLGLEFGFGGLHDPLSKPDPPELKVQRQLIVGLVARATASLRVPIASGLALGAETSAEAWISLLHVNRTAFGAFVEFSVSGDGGEESTR